MRQFTELFLALDQSNKTSLKTQALLRFLEESSDEDKVWGIALLMGKRPKRIIRSADLRQWAQELSALPEWLFEETYHIVGDLAETIAKILPDNRRELDQSLTDWMLQIIACRDLELEAKKEFILGAWDSLGEWERFVFNKMLMGGFRLGVSQKLTAKAIALYTQKEESEIAHRLMGNWQAQEQSFEQLFLSEQADDDHSKPYPFYLAYQVEGDPENLGPLQDWQAEWKWDGIRGQLIFRGDRYFLWSRGEELISAKFPEFESLVGKVPNGTVIDGEVLIYKDGNLRPFQDLQTRIGRKAVSKKTLQDTPAVIRAYDLLEWQGEDLRSKPMTERRTLLESLFNSYDFSNSALQLSPIIEVETWDDLKAERLRARELRSEGLMLKRKDSGYQFGRKKGDWWKWKLEPLTIDAVLIYGMRGHGRRSNLYTDYTFAVWDGPNLVPFTKAYSGLKDDEFRAVDQFIKKNTLERFGPVRSVKPELVFEIAFEGIQASKRHKSGVALRFPRMKRWRQDKPASEANSLQDLKDMLETYGL